MTNAHIYCPANNIMQSGKAKAGQWVLEFEPSERKVPDALMGWSGSGDMHQQIKMRFTSCDDAKAYADRVGLEVDVISPNVAKKTFRNYADRFAFDRVK